jgi:hypothetical protein
MTGGHSHGPRRSRPHPSGPRPTTDRRDHDRSPVAPALMDDPVVAGAVHWVRVTCPTCGVVRVETDRVVVRNCVDDQTWSYRARCSQCDTIFIGFTPESLALPALAAGVSVETWTLPIPSPRRSGSALRAIDALELHLALLDDDWFDQFSQAEPRGDR